MTVEVNMSDERRWDPQVRNAAVNILYAFYQTLGGPGILQDREYKGIPKCEGLTEWAKKRFGIDIAVEYRARIETFGELKPNPMDDDEQGIIWDSPFVPMDYSRQGPLSKDEERLLMDPVFVGPRSLEERKFLRSQAIKLGIRKKTSRKFRFYSEVYGSLQTPELKRWAEDLAQGCVMFANNEDAWQWTYERGYKSSVFWQQRFLDIDRIKFTMPGCEGKPDSYERLLFVMKFGAGGF